MCRIISLLLVLALIMGVFSVNTLCVGAEDSNYALNRASFLSGDIDSSGNVDLTDVVALAQYVVGWEIECCIAALDPNGDTYCDLEDVVHLARYIAEWQIGELSSDVYVPENKEENGNYYTETLRVYNGEAPVIDEYRGMSGSIYHAYGYMEDDKYGRNYTDAQRKTELDRLDDSGVRFARTNYNTRWTWEGAYYGYNWDSTRINGFWNYCKSLQSRDISVVLQVGWHLGCFTKMESYANSLIEADYIQELSYSDIYGESADYDFLQCENFDYRQMARRSLRMGENLAQMILQAKARGINNIGYFSYFVEPSYPTEALDSTDPAYGYEGAFADEYVFIVKTIQQKLKDRGVYNLVKHMGPNQSIKHGDGLLRYVMERDLTDMFDVWTSHFYPSAYYSSENIYFDLSDPVFEAYLQTLKDEGIYGEAEFWVDDFYCRAVDAKLGIDDAYVGLQNAVCAIAAQQRGINNLSLWAIFDQLWIDQKNSGGEFKNGIHICGSAPSLFVSDIPRKQYYITGLFAKYNGYKNGKVYRTNNYDLHYYGFGDVSIGAVLLEDGNWTITVVNAYEESYKITVNFDKAINQTLYKYSQSVNNIVPTSDASLAKAEEMFRKVQTKFTDVVEPYSVTVYTGCKF